MSFLAKLFGAKSAKEALTDYSSLQVDMHSHLIPQVDDGSKSMDDTLLYISKYKELGYRKIITTPHSIKGGYDNTAENLIPARDQVRQAMNEAGIEMEFDVAAEYYLDDFFLESIGKEPLLKLSRDYLLFEFPFAFLPHFYSSAIFKLNSSGYKPVLAHPERYTFLHGKNVDKYKEIKDMGVCFQLNISSIIGVYGPSVARAAAMLIDEGMFEFLGSDLHTEKHFTYLEKGLQNEGVLKAVKSGRLLNNTL